jgi:hypothetical protein
MFFCNFFPILYVNLVLFLSTVERMIFEKARAFRMYTAPKGEERRHDDEEGIVSGSSVQAIEEKK